MGGGVRKETGPGQGSWTDGRVGEGYWGLKEPRQTRLGPCCCRVPRTDEEGTTSLAKDTVGPDSRPRSRREEG